MDRIVCSIGIGSFLLATAGCHLPDMIDGMGWNPQFRQTFTALNPEEESVAQVDVATVTWRRDQPMLQEGLWAELDEQFIPLELRQQLAQHGLRVGLMRSAAGSRLQATLANPEFCRNSIDSARDVVQYAELPSLQSETRKFVPMCVVESRRILSRNEQEVFWPVGPRGGSAKLIVPDAEKEYLTREVSELELQFVMQLQKTNDGATRIQIVPMIRCALNAQDNTNGFLDSLRLKNAISKLEQRYQKLALEVSLTQDQYLVITATPALRPLDSTADTWGDLAFMKYPTDQQVVLVVRGASVLPSRPPEQPRKGNAWPLAWQAAVVQPPANNKKPCNP
ncbi:MAG TPA: hypothetical protein PKA06_05975 [Gemmatales bacterium]|nr:hypothetical protein [Gemmatales bacterium]